MPANYVARFNGNRNNMRHLKWIIPIFILFGAYVVSKIVRGSRPTAPVAEKTDVRPTVKTITAHTMDYRPFIKTQGTVRPKTSIELVPEVAGKIVWVSPSFNNGGAFEKGAILVRIDPRNYQFAIEAANANVADAQAKLAKEVAEGEIAKQDWDDISGGRIATDLALRKPQLAGATAALASARASLSKAKLDLDRTNITAPFAGRVDVKRTGIGQYVSLGKVLADLYSTDMAEIHLPLTDTQMGKIDLYAKNGIEVKLFANVGGKRQSWTGRALRTSGSVDQASRVLRLIVEVNDPYNTKDGQSALLNGLFVEAEIPGVEFSNVIEIPRRALRSGNKIVIVEDGKIWTREVSLIHTSTKNTYIQGVPDGTPIVTSALEIMIEGMTVNQAGVKGDGQ